ncbi:MAG: hypothetical protein HDT15_11385 [Oscillibacter sp.]|nr:hypothetical protein [Oscillibacter sp.]MBD5155628.1 hypothetical protein [Oscillibacter sp.]
MFYTKTKINEETSITTLITAENVFTTCIDCGNEISVDLDGMIVDGHLDLYAMGCRCEACSLEHAKKHRGEPWANMIIAEHMNKARGV